MALSSSSIILYLIIFVIIIHLFFFFVKTWSCISDSYVVLLPFWYELIVYLYVVFFSLSIPNSIQTEIRVQITILNLEHSSIHRFAGNKLNIDQSICTWNKILAPKINMYIRYLCILYIYIFIHTNKNRYWIQLTIPKRVCVSLSRPQSNVLLLFWLFLLLLLSASRQRCSCRFRRPKYRESHEHTRILTQTYTYTHQTICPYVYVFRAWALCVKRKIRVCIVYVRSHIEIGYLLCTAEKNFLCLYFGLHP